MYDLSDWSDLQSRLVSASLLLCVSAVCIYLGNYFHIVYFNAGWSYALGIGQDVNSYFFAGNVV